MTWQAVEPKRSCWAHELATAVEVDRQEFEGVKVVMVVVRDENGRCWRYCTFEEATRALLVEEVLE